MHVSGVVADMNSCLSSTEVWQMAGCLTRTSVVAASCMGSVGVIIPKMMAKNLWHMHLFGWKFVFGDEYRQNSPLPMPLSWWWGIPLSTPYHSSAVKLSDPFQHRTLSKTIVDRKNLKHFPTKRCHHSQSSAEPSTRNRCRRMSWSSVSNAMLRSSRTGIWLHSSATWIASFSTLRTTDYLASVMLWFLFSM